jgi:hypothetical protein
VSSRNSGCKTPLLIIGYEKRLRVFKNKVSRKIFGFKREEVTGNWKKVA